MISIHPESVYHLSRSLSLIRGKGCEAGIVFNPATPLSYLDWVMNDIDFVLVMSVNPGFGGPATNREFHRKSQRSKVKN